MINIKNISILALFLLLVGTIGAILTFQFMSKAEEISEGKLIDDNHFANINISTDNSRVEILPTNDSKARAELSGKAKKYTFEANVEGDTLVILLKDKHWKLINFDFWSNTLLLKVFVPEKQYDSIKVRSNNGRVQAEKLEAKDIHIETDNGRILLADINGSNIITKADNGRTELKNVAASTVSVKAANGKILLDNVEGTISGKANNGSITLITKQLDRSIDLSTDNGQIKIETENEPSNAAFSINVHNGKVDVFGHSDRNMTFGKGENIIKLSTHNGRITVTK